MSATDDEIPVSSFSPCSWFDGFDTPALALDLQGNVVAWNQRLVNFPLINVRRFESFQALLSEESISCWKEAFRDCLEGNPTQCLLKFGNETVNCQARISGVTNNQSGRKTGVLVFLENIVRANNAAFDNCNENALEAACSGFLVSSELAGCAVDTEGKVRLWNAGLTSLMSLSLEEVLGKSFVSILQPTAVEPLLDILDRGAAGEATSNFDIGVTTQDRDTRFLRINCLPVRNAHSVGVVGMLVFLTNVTESVRERARLVDQCRDLRTTFERANIPIFGIDRNGIVNEWNDEVAEISGYSRTEACGTPFLETFTFPSQTRSLQEVMEKSLNGRGVSNFKLELRTVDGETRQLLATSKTRTDTTGAVTGAIIYAHDETEKQVHERYVTAVATELRQLIDAANAPIFGTDLDGDINEWNSKVEEITGYSKEEAFDQNLVDTFIVPYMRESILCVVEDALEGRETSNFKLEFLTKSRELRHFLVNATTRRDSLNRVKGVVWVAQDVTESVQRDKAVAGMALELRQLIDSANAPIFGVDIDGNINEWNRKIQEVTGFTKEDTFDEPLVEKFVTPRMRKIVRDKLGAALKGKETSKYELEFISKSGEPRCFVVNATTRRDPDFNVVGAVGVAQDVTEDRKHTAELQRMQYLQATQEAKVETERNMTAYFAHELRNPLCAIDSALNIMPDDLPKSAQSLVDGMKLCSSFMSTIMNNLLDVRKMEEGKMTLLVQPLSLGSLVTRVHKMLLPSVKSGVTFTSMASTIGRDWVIGDPHRLQQVLTNVVTNAIKYTGSGSIDLLVEWEDNNVKFTCIDTGPGIPLSEQEKLFQRFVQRGGAPGTGLGLAIAKNLVDLVGGTIKFYSDPSQRPGTTCVVLLPLRECEPGDDASQNDNGLELIVEPLRFLVVDDVQLNRSMLKRRIQKAVAPNCVVFEAATGEEALEICADSSFDIIVVDQFMEEAGGVMVGTDVVYAMRRMRIESVIIGCSGNDLDKEFEDAGADFVWKKPMPSNKQIISDVRKALDARK